MFFQIGTKQWRYYDFGPKVVPPLICIPGTAVTADVYYKQIMALSMKGYRVISIDIPHVCNKHEWVQAFEKFLDVIDVHRIHLYGTSLGGFLALLFAQYRPRRVKSLVLSNTFLETKYFAAAMPWAPVVSWTPSFLLKRYVLTGIMSGPHEPFIADSVDFVVAQVETLSREDLASRLALTTNDASIGPLLLSDSLITIIDLHLRRVGVEAREDLVPGIPKASDDDGGSGEPKDDKEDTDDAPNGDGSKSNPGGPSSSDSQPPLVPENNESHNPDNQPHGGTTTKGGDPLLPEGFSEIMVTSLLH
ncbi:hypothetical protein M8C21_009718, partial [Ambrosia artemisiifolia]